jgi:phage regulator Rha-like protein
VNKDGFTLLAMGFTGTKATKFKLRYINAFNQMESELKQTQAALPTDPLGQIALLAKGTTQLVEKVDKLTETVDELGENQVLNSEKYDYITRAVSRAVRFYVDAHKVL